MTLTKHLVKIENNIITEPPQFFTAPDGTFHQDFYNNEELIEKYGFNYELTDEEFALYRTGNGFKVEDNKFIDVRDIDEEYKSEKAKYEQSNLIELNYTLKAKTAYTGVICTVNDKKLVFQTNETSLIMIASTITAFLNNSSMLSTCWKFWTANEATNYPVFVNLTKEQFLSFYNFTLTLGTQAFSLEEQFNEIIQNLSVDDLLDSEKMLALNTQMNEAYSAISNDIGVIEEAQPAQEELTGIEEPTEEVQTETTTETEEPSEPVEQTESTDTTTETEEPTASESDETIETEPETATDTETGGINE